MRMLSPTGHYSSMDIDFSDSTEIAHLHPGTYVDSVYWYHNLCSLSQMWLPASQVAMGQLIEGWFPLFEEDGKTLMKSGHLTSMLHIVVQYQNVLQVSIWLKSPFPLPPKLLLSPHSLNRICNFLTRLTSCDRSALCPASLS